MSKKAVFSVILYPQPQGGYTALCPEMREAVAQGETIEEALANIRDVIASLLDLDPDKEDLIELARPELGRRIYTEVELSI